MASSDNIQPVRQHLEQWRGVLLDTCFDAPTAGVEAALREMNAVYHRALESHRKTPGRWTGGRAACRGIELVRVAGAPQWSGSTPQADPNTGIPHHSLQMPSGVLTLIADNPSGTLGAGAGAVTAGVAPIWPLLFHYDRASGDDYSVHCAKHAEGSGCTLTVRARGSRPTHTDHDLIFLVARNAHGPSYALVELVRAPSGGSGGD